MTDPLVVHPEDLDDEWPATAQRRGVRLRSVTAILAGLVLLAAGFWGGVEAEHHHGSTPAATGSLASLVRGLATGGARSANGTGRSFAGSGGAFGAATEGIVTGVQGDVLYVTDASGNLVKVTLKASTTVTRTSQSTLNEIKTGDTVVVVGTKTSGGTVSATSIRATAQGASATFGPRTAGGGG